ncbi:MAG: transketolase [Pseudomonadota bacterium]|nr:transketolase [Pseudomonadota bacterium]
MALSPESADDQPTRRQLANAIRALSMDAVQSANSGHPGAPMGMADIAEVLWNDFLRHNPANPMWPDRDRFVLSNGHGSMLLYSLLHLTGYPLTINEIRNFRQLNSITAGHPEYEPEVGIETTTGPLGQGITNAVGMALAEKILAASFNKPNYEVIDHRTWVFLGDGCLMEGISHEACSLAGTLGLGKLIAFYDDNGISIDGEVGGWFTDDTPSRFRAYGWQVISDVDGHNPDSITKAIEQAIVNNSQPTLICCKTIIGFGAPNKQGTESTHGAPLGEDEILAAREELDWQYEPFEIPDAIRKAWDGNDRGKQLEEKWLEKMEQYSSEFPDQFSELQRRFSNELPIDWSDYADAALNKIISAETDFATRKDSQVALNALAKVLPELIGGSADLTGSNLTMHDLSVPITPSSAQGNYIYFGVREFGMAAILNGITLHGGFIPYGGTFLTFSDYARNALRMAALMKLRSILVFTHDSIGLGEDGPTHQPIEHIESLRLIPNMTVWRPCDGVETFVAWRDAVERVSGPTSLILSRQSLPHQDRDSGKIAQIRSGGYVLKDAPNPQVILIATGSEVGLAVLAADELSLEGISVRVVSMPCRELFMEQDIAYRDSVLLPDVNRIAIEAGTMDGWRGLVGDGGEMIGMSQFGSSAPAPELFEKYGFTVKRIKEVVNQILFVD